MHGTLKALYDLAAYVGKPAQLAAATFCAYLIGAMVEVKLAHHRPLIRYKGNWVRETVHRPFMVLGMLLSGRRPTWPFRSEAGFRAIRNPTISPECWDDLCAYALSKMNEAPVSTGRRFITRGYALESQEDGEFETFVLGRPDLVNLPRADNGLGEPFALGLRVLYELDVHRARLSKDLPETFAEHERLASQADFMANVAVSLLGLVLALAIEDSLWWGAALLLPVVLFLRALRRSSESNDVIVQALIAGQLSWEFPPDLMPQSGNDSNPNDAPPDRPDAGPAPVGAE